MDSFVEIFIGSPILKPLGITARLFSSKIDLKSIKENKRISGNDVETRYICRMLGMPYNEKFISKNENLIDPIRKIRTQIVKNIRGDIKNNFKIRVFIRENTNKNISIPVVINAEVRRLYPKNKLSI